MDAFTTALDWAAAIKAKEVSPVEVSDLYLARIDELDGGLNAFSHQDPEEVRRRAGFAADALTRADDPADLPPFLGVPLPIKNLNPVAGWPCTYGSKGASAGPRLESDPIVDRFVAGGFVLLGMTNSPEFGTISFTESDAHGVTRNPWDPERTPGGSSGGAAAAVAAGMAPIAHASDGGGSIRIPASCCGLVGHKPSRGRVPNEFIELEGFVSEHVVARTVADSAAVLDVLAVIDPLVFFSAPQPPSSYATLAAQAPPRLRVGFTTIPTIDVPVDAACVAAVESAATALEAAGHDVFEATLDVGDPDAFLGAFTNIWNTGSAWSPIEDPDAMEPLNQVLKAMAQEVDSLAFAAAVRETQRLARPILANFGRDLDLLLTPTMACLPPKVGSWREGMDVEPVMGLLNCTPMAAFTAVWNVCGLPATSVPTHVDAASGLPVGVQLVAPPWRDELCLQVAAQLEQALPWAGRHPAIGS
ncbi:MAG: amidase [Actinomycetota bacterium]|nr:amidase [Acidimicrobiia bacterium]MDQ3294286.1 amidase [Actinomycetota bacterium]